MDDYLAAYGLTGWFVQVEYGHADNAAGMCLAEPEYEQATIWLDPEAFSTLEQLDETFRHELSHIVESPVMLFWEAVRHFFPDTATEKAMQRVMLNSRELIVRNIERMHTGHTQYRFKKAK